MSALDLPSVKVDILYTNFKHHISQHILSTWQDDCNGAVVNKLHSVPPVLEDIDSPLIGNAGWMKLSCVVSASVIHI